MIYSRIRYSSMNDNENPFYLRRKGTLKNIVLLALSENKKKGIHIIEEIEKRSMGFWRPSPGTIYPYLKELQSEGLVSKDSEGYYKLTEKGNEFIKSRFGDSYLGRINTGERCLDEMEGCIELLGELQLDSNDQYRRLIEIKEKLEFLISKVKNNASSRNA